MEIVKKYARCGILKLDVARFDMTVSILIIEAIFLSELTPKILGDVEKLLEIL